MHVCMYVCMYVCVLLDFTQECGASHSDYHDSEGSYVWNDEFARRREIFFTAVWGISSDIQLLLASRSKTSKNASNQYNLVAWKAVWGLSWGMQLLVASRSNLVWRLAEEYRQRCSWLCCFMFAVPKVACSVPHTNTVCMKRLPWILAHCPSLPGFRIRNRPHQDLRHEGWQSPASVDQNVYMWAATPTINTQEKHDLFHKAMSGWILERLTWTKSFMTVSTRHSVAPMSTIIMVLVGRMLPSYNWIVNAAC